jgi:hypothetical protein
MNRKQRRATVSQPCAELPRRRALVEVCWGTAIQKTGPEILTARGVFRERVSDRPGVYRAIAVRKELNGGNNVCLRDLSPRVKHRH